MPKLRGCRAWCGGGVPRRRAMTRTVQDSSGTSAMIRAVQVLRRRALRRAVPHPQWRAHAAPCSASPSASTVLAARSSSLPPRRRENAHPRRRLHFPRGRQALHPRRCRHGVARRRAPVPSGTHPRWRVVSLSAGVCRSMVLPVASGSDLCRASSCSSSATTFPATYTLCLGMRCSCASAL